MGNLPDSAKATPVVRAKRVESGHAPWRDIATYLHPGESAPDFKRLREDLFRDLVPADVIERLWCEDIVTLIWESHRLRRVKGALLAVQKNERIRDRLCRFNSLNFMNLDGIMAAYRQGDQAAMNEVERALASDPLGGQDGLTLDYLEGLDKMLTIDRAIESADKRRDTLLSNLYLRRDMLGERATKSLPPISS